MNEQIEKILELPVKHKIGILGGLMLLVCGGYWLNFYKPIGEEVTTIQESIDGPTGIRVKIAQREGIAKNLEKYRAKVKDLDGELNKALQELPDSREIDELLAKVSDKVRDAGLEIRLFKPESEVKREFFAEVPVQIEVTGTYHQVATFFDEVGRLSRIVNLDRFLMSEPNLDPGNGVLIKTGVVATAFRFLDENERPTSEDGKNEKHRRRKKTDDDDKILKK